MAKIKEFNRHVCRELSKEIEGKLKPLANKYGLHIKIGGGSFIPENYTVKLEIATIARNGEVQTKESRDFKALAQFHGLKTTDLGRVFIYAGNRYEITGMRPKSRKYPIMARNVSTRKAYKFGVHTVKDGLEVEAS